jgi:heme-degrading monooxygenase HmoA
VGRLRQIAAPFVAGAPAGARGRTRLRVSAEDAAVLRAVGSHLGSLAAGDLAARCAEGRLDARGRAVSRRERKRALTAGSSSRWAGAITRVSEDQWRLADRNLHAERASLRARVRRIEARAAVPTGGKNGRVRGYATPAERHTKAIRLKTLKGRLSEVQRRLDSGAVSVVRGGKNLLCKRNNLAAAGLTEDQWRQQWDAARLFLTADGEAGKRWGNETIRFNPDEGWVEVKLPAPLASLANESHGRYRLSCPVAFSYRGDEVAAQAATGAIRYDITLDPASGRWYLDASWTVPRRPAPALGELRRDPVVAVDLNAGHLGVAVVASDGNVLGVPFTVPLDLAGRPAATRDGRLRAAVSGLIATAREHGARAVVVEDLDFTQARDEGRERDGNRPSRGKRGCGFRRLVAGIPTGKLCDRLVQMTANAGLSVIVVDPAYSSRWGAQHWLAPLREHHPKATGHHAAALVLGRRGLGHRAGRRANGNRAAPEDAARPAPARPRRPPAAGPAPRKPATPRGPRQPPGTKTGRPHRTTAGDQAAQHRTGPPAPQDHLLHARLGTVARIACAGGAAPATTSRPEPAAPPQARRRAMFARVITARAGAEGFDGAIRLAEQQLPGARQMPGFQGYYLLTDAETGKLVIISLWETREQMDAVTAGAGASGIRDQGIPATELTALHLETYEVAMHI